MCDYQSRKLEKIFTEEGEIAYLIDVRRLLLLCFSIWNNIEKFLRDDYRMMFSHKNLRTEIMRFYLDTIDYLSLS